MNSFDTQVHPEEMNFDQFTPEERAEFEAIQFEIELEAWETVRGEEEFWDKFNRKHNPQFYDKLKKSKTKEKKTEKKKTSRANTTKRHPVFKVQN